LDVEHGFGLTTNNELLRTADGGKTWVPVAIPGAAVGGCFVSPTVGMVSVASPNVTVLRTTDGGVTWRQTLQRPSPAEYANLDCTQGLAQVEVVYQNSMQGGVSEVLTSPWNDRWSVLWTNCDLSTCNPRSNPSTSPELAGKPDASGRLPTVLLTTAGAVVVYPADFSHSYVTLKVSVDGRSISRTSDTQVLRPPNAVQHFGGFGATFSDTRQGYVVIQLIGQRRLTVLRTADGGATWHAAASRY
jgi:hypothetical protein